MVIGYGTIMIQDRIIQLGMIAKLKSNILHWGGAAVTIVFLYNQVMGPVKINILKHKIKEVLTKTA